MIRNSEGGKESTLEDYLSVRAKIQRNNQAKAYSLGTALINTDTVWIRYSSEVNGLTQDWKVAYSGADHVIHVIERIKGWVRLIVKNETALSIL
jgi:SPP1 family predicted phage head-tail adaptor